MKAGSSELSTYFAEIRWTCSTCDPEAGIRFLYPVPVVAPPE
jgi:hypothetical protein